MSNIKYIGKDTKELEKGKIHVKNGNHTACGARIDDNREDWKITNSPVNCNKNGCK